MPFCTKCSTELDESWNACPNCGNIRPDRPSDQIKLREGGFHQYEVSKLSDIGEGVVEGEITAWHVAVGDTVVEDQVMVDIMTDKVTVQIDSTVDGKVTKLHGAIGDMIAVGGPLIEFEVEASEPGSVSSPSELDFGGKSVDELRSRIEYLRTTGLNTQKISEDLKLQPSTIEWLSPNTGASDIEKPPDTGRTAPDNQEQKCLNCGRKINTTKTGPISRAIEWFLGLFFRQSEAEKAESAANKIAPQRCNCGLPIFSDPKNMKKTNDLFWISKESFKPTHWSNIESRGLFNRTVEKYAFRIVNDVQRLDTTVQFKLIRRKIFVQQDGRNIVSESRDRVARIALTNEHGTQHEYWISVSLTNIRVETKKPNGFTEIRWWIVPTR